MGFPKFFRKPRVRIVEDGEPVHWAAPNLSYFPYNGHPAQSLPTQPRHLQPQLQLQRQVQAQPRRLPQYPQEPRSSHRPPRSHNQPPRQLQQVNTVGELVPYTNHSEGYGLVVRWEALGIPPEWRHMMRCTLCHGDNMCREVPGQYPCELYLATLRGPCTGNFFVSLEDAGYFILMPLFYRVPFDTFSDRYDYIKFMHKLWAMEVAKMRAAADARRYIGGDQRRVVWNN